MSNKQQTAVEWQHIELMRINFEYSTSKITPREFQEQIKHILEQAKEMEKEQIIDGFGVGCQVESTRLIGYHKMAAQYYNKTYGGNK
jgi:hypothetical protein